MDCVKGKCVETGEFLGLGFKCECDPGWTQIQLGPLTIPACTLPNCESPRSIYSFDRTFKIALQYITIFLIKSWHLFPKTLIFFHKLTKEIFKKNMHFSFCRIKITL